MTIHANILQALRKCPEHLIPLSRAIGLKERDDLYLVNALQELEEWGLIEYDYMHGYRQTETMQ